MDQRRNPWPGPATPHRADDDLLQTPVRETLRSVPRLPSGHPFGSPVPMVQMRATGCARLSRPPVSEPARLAASGVCSHPQGCDVAGASLGGASAYAAGGDGGVLSLPPDAPPAAVTSTSVVSRASSDGAAVCTSSPFRDAVWAIRPSIALCVSARTRQEAVPCPMFGTPTARVLGFQGRTFAPHPAGASPLPVPGPVAGPHRARPRRAAHRVIRGGIPCTGRPRKPGRLRKSRDRRVVAAHAPAPAGRLLRAGADRAERRRCDAARPRSVADRPLQRRGGPLTIGRGPGAMVARPHGTGVGIPGAACLNTS